MQQHSIVSAAGFALCFSFLVGCGASASEEPTSSEPTASSDPSTTLGAQVGSSTTGTSSTATGTDGVAAGAAIGATSGTTGATEDTAIVSLNASPKPTSQCSVSKDSSGFFVRTSGKSSYVAYVPASYTGNEPMRVVVGLHGCSDTAMNFATWGVNPWDTRKTQQHIGISVDGASGGAAGSNSCWTKGSDDAKVLAAVDDLAKCFWLDRSKVTLAGYSSGGELAYKVALENADEFDGLIIEDSGLYANSNPDQLLANAAWRLPIAHITHTDDGVFPLSKVQADWAKTTAAGFPLTTKVVAGTHSGTSDDWNTFLLPKITAWQH